MKKIFNKSLTLIILISGLLICSPVMADDPPPPPMHNETGDIPAGGGAPVGEGLMIITLLGAGYGLKKWHSIHKQNNAA